MNMPTTHRAAPSFAHARSALRHGLKALCVLAALCLAPTAQAQAVVGTVTHLSGLLTATRSDGSSKLLAIRSAVHEGDTLVTAADTYAKVQFVDDATLIMEPQSRLRVASYVWAPDSPAADHVVLELQQGGMQSETGLLGKRNHDAISIKLPDAEIKVHGTNFTALIVPVPSAGASPTPPGISAILPPGLYVSVIDGMISVSNRGGAANFAAGQFGFTASLVQPPVVVPANPGLKFTPPPAFNSSVSATTTNSSATKSNTVDCEVR
jgi:hypothetical protein